MFEIPIPPKPGCALVLLGHGSTLNPDSSAPTFHHADTIRNLGLFDEVVCAFWKEQPTFREIYEMVASDEIYLVPVFISEGYFCQQVLPRELELDGPLTHRGRRTIKYCRPVGVHDSMLRLLLQRAKEVAPGVPPGETSLIIVGHGTSLNENSTEAIKRQVQLIRESGAGFAEVHDAYMEEAPFIAEWDQMSTAPNVVVVPFFIADALHSYQDIPVLLGLEQEPTEAASKRSVFRDNPRVLRDKNLFYSGAIGTEPLMAGVILDQIADFDAAHPPGPPSPSVSPHPTVVYLKEKLAHGPVHMGELILVPHGAGCLISHRDDSAALQDNPESLVRRQGLIEARELSFNDADGAYRPLKTAPGLARGWFFQCNDLSATQALLEEFYPAGLALAAHATAGQLKTTPLREALGRQTGMYRFAHKVSDDGVAELMRSGSCATGSCQRRIFWNLTAESPVPGLEPERVSREIPEGEIPLICKEACSLLVAGCREVSRKEAGMATA